MNKTMIIGGSTAVTAALTALVLSITTPKIEEFEGVRYQAYRDVVGVLTVCAGSTGPQVKAGKTYTKEECTKMTDEDVKKHMHEVLKHSPHLVYHPIVLASMTSFTYNVGGGAYGKSTIKKLINEGKFTEACNFLPRYKYAGGKVVNGLVKRRAVEQEICLSSLTP